jgi:hypothetical protein
MAKQKHFTQKQTPPPYPNRIKQFVDQLNRHQYSRAMLSIPIDLNISKGQWYLILRGEAQLNATQLQYFNALTRLPMDEIIIGDPPAISKEVKEMFSGLKVKL